MNILGTKVSLITIGVCLPQNSTQAIFPIYLNISGTRFGQQPQLVVIPQLQSSWCTMYVMILTVFKLYPVVTIILTIYLNS